MITFRPMNIETDAADMARLFSYTKAEPITAQTAREWWTLRKDQVRFTTLALDENGQAIGYSDVEREAWMQPGRYFLKVIVAPEFRNQKLGTQMTPSGISSEGSNTTLPKSAVRCRGERL